MIIGSGGTTNVNVFGDNFEDRRYPPDAAVPEPQNVLFAKLRQFAHRHSFLTECFKLLLFSTFGIAIYVMFITPRVGTRYSVQDKIVSGADLIIDKNIRGIFPPLADNTTLLIGTWVIDVKESKTHGSSIVTYSLEFKKNGALSILKTKCNGDIPMKWKSYFNNLVLTEINHGLDTSMIISNLPEDEACIRGSDGFVDQLLDASIWTVYDKKLFLLIERKHKQEEINQVLVLDALVNAV